MAVKILVALLVFTFILFGIFYGRLFCSKLCPFGFLQDLLYLIPFPKKIRSFKCDQYLRYVKYILLLLLLVWNLFGDSYPLVNEVNTYNASLVLKGVTFVLLGIVISRPYCKYLCPVGGILGLFNLFSFDRYNVNHSCTRCGICSRSCKMDLEPFKKPNSIECIR